MINILLIFPLIACLILVLTKTKILNILFLNLYAIIHIIISFCYFFKNDLVEKMTPMPYFEVDALNIIFLCVLSIVFMASAIYNNGYIKNKNYNNIELRKYVSTIILFVFSMTGAILSADLAVAWIFVEATTLASGYLIYFQKTKHSMEAAWKYIFMCSIGIALAFVGIILVSIAIGQIGSLKYTDLYANYGIINHFWLKIAFIFILFGFGTKMGLAPVHFWLPDAHAQAPSAISALLSASLLNCAFLIILRIYKLMIIMGIANYAKFILLMMGLLSIFIATVFLYKSKNYKRMLAYSSIENMGIMSIASAIGGVGMYACILHLIGHSLIKASFFLTSGNILTLFKNKEVKAAYGIHKVDSKTAWLFIISCVGIIAIPPSLIFLSEFMIIKEMLIQKQFLLCAIFALLLTIILFGISKTVFKMAFSEGKEENIETAINNTNKLHVSMYVPQVLLLTLVFYLGMYIPKILDDWIKHSIMGF